MQHIAFAVIVYFAVSNHRTAIPKPHVISFGKWTAAKWCAGTTAEKAVDLKIRGLLVDTCLKEYTIGLRTK